MVRADAVVVAVVEVAVGRTAVVGGAGLSRTLVTRLALEQPVAHLGLHACRNVCGGNSLTW